MLKIRLARIGKKQHPSYRIVVCESRTKRNCRPVEIIGNYQAIQSLPTININQKRLDYWLKFGARLTPAVSGLIKENEKTS